MPCGRSVFAAGLGAWRFPRKALPWRRPPRDRIQRSWTERSMPWRQRIVKKKKERVLDGHILKIMEEQD